MILDAWRDQAAVIWPAILVSSFLMLLGFSRAGSTVFWKPGTDPAPVTTREPLAFAAAFALLGGLVALTVLAGPVTGWLMTTTEALNDPAALIAANRLSVAP